MTTAFNITQWAYQQWARSSATPSLTNKRQVPLTASTLYEREIQLWRDIFFSHLGRFRPTGFTRVLLQVPYQS